MTNALETVCIRDGIKTAGVQRRRPERAAIEMAGAGASVRRRTSRWNWWR